MFFALSFIFILSAVIITLRILIGYNPELPVKRKLGISFAVIFAWFCPVFTGMMHRAQFFSVRTNTIVSQSLYVLFITAFFLFCLLLGRDILWIWGYKLLKIIKKAPAAFDPMNPALLKKVNVWTVAATFLLSGYALYEGLKFPALKETDILTPKVSSPFKIVALTDLHLTPATPLSRIDKIVRTVNGLNPDAVVLVGDIVDAKPDFMDERLQALAGLKAKHGVFLTLGNHEFYHGSVVWERRFKNTGFDYLANDGRMLEDANVYVSGLPDPQLLTINDTTMKSIERTLKEAPYASYKVFLSHSPRFIRKLNDGLIDLQISGHTHGGQIFPFHFAVKRFNDFVAGLYDVEGMKLYISRGASGWGPPMRLFAPSEISVINLIPEGN